MSSSFPAPRVTVGRHVLFPHLSLAGRCDYRKNACENRNSRDKTFEMPGESNIGARVREIRERIGMQAQELADLVNLDPSAISNIERGRRSLKSDELLAIAKALGVSPLAILEDDSLLGRLPVAPRSAQGTVLRGDVLDRLTGLAELHEVLREWEDPRTFVRRFPEVDTTRWLEVAPELANWTAGQFADLPFGDDRFSGLVHAIELQLGVDVLIEERGSASVAGASITDSEFPLIFINNASQPVTRALFTLAHEVGHILVQDGDVVVDEDLVAHSNSERFANAFAAALLLPEAEIRDEVRRSDAMTLCRVLDRYGTSYETLVYRLHNLRIINAAGRDKLRALGLRGLISQIDDKALVTRLLGRLNTRPMHHAPSLLAERAFNGYRRGVISSRPLAGLLGVSPDIVAAGMELDAEATLDDAIELDASDTDSDADVYGGSPVD